MNVAELLQQLDTGALIELFSISTVPIGGTDVFRFHSGTNKLNGDVVWQGVTYTMFPIQADGFEKSIKGTLPRPRLLVANVSGLITPILTAYDDLVGASVTRKVTFARYLDAVNFKPIRNKFTNSDRISGSSFIRHPVELTVVDSGLPGPQGDLVADEMIEGTLSSGWYASRSSDFTSGLLYTLSCYWKAGQGSTRFPQLAFTSAAFGSGLVASFNLDTGEVSVNSGSITASMEKLDEGWWRCSARSIATITAASSSVQFRMSKSMSTYAPTYTGDGVSSLYCWGAQLEVGGLSDYQSVGAVSSPNPTADPTQYLPDEVYFVEKKVNQNKVVVEFELSSALDLNGLQLPSRDILANVCGSEYRSAECGYTGTNYFDVNNSPVGSLALDVCSQSVAGCKCRFAASGVIPFGGFPAARVYKV